MTNSNDFDPAAWEKRINSSISPFSSIQRFTVSRKGLHSLKIDTP